MFYRCPIQPFVSAITSWRSYSTGIQLSILWWLYSVPQTHVLQVSNWAFCGCTQFLRFIFYRYPTELFVVILSSSGSYSPWFWLSLLWLSSVSQARILQLSNWASCGCSQFLRLMFYKCLSFLCLYSVPQTHILRVSNWAFCVCIQFLRLIFYRYPTELFVVIFSSSGSYSTWFWLSFLWLSSVTSN